MPATPGSSEPMTGRGEELRTTKMKAKNRAGIEVEVREGARVRPSGVTGRGFSYGYVRKVVACPHDPREHGREQAIVYWPQGRTLGGGWTSIDLVVLDGGAS